jgi:hypothetical protein
MTYTEKQDAQLKEMHAIILEYHSNEATAYFMERFVFHYGINVIDPLNHKKVRAVLYHLNNLANKSSDQKKPKLQNKTIEKLVQCIAKGK